MFFVTRKISSSVLLNEKLCARSSDVVAIASSPEVGCVNDKIQLGKVFFKEFLFSFLQFLYFQRRESKFLLWVGLKPSTRSITCFAGGTFAPSGLGLSLKTTLYCFSNLVRSLAREGWAFSRSFRRSPVTSSNFCSSVHGMSGAVSIGHGCMLAMTGESATLTGLTTRSSNTDHS
jgi:hypothetical protein